ncbi:serine hydrolase-domain-containing protein [Lentinula edodes]|uniref:FSH1-domain-containing protein n=1 Tax=Lentinula edodes TaxID=5353 RepID=A0A1Q3EB43_LENED|nr:serine hydrolase-domain-containing protein [Lentinula edodes]KAH7867937.1 serine hydrolase-domain-containing protein [Lentinula edodes]KAJ3898827.1 serine hydrolase-domain-containing protein [Lentinula edodes]KAJ3913484.1 serine hydrolase-domain-containing protein [Lentinula edodes]GAW04371.1 FSH1-domain-containing protein [Lentinula edodes]
MPTRILVLHGYCQNAFHAYRRLAPVIEGCGDQVQFYFLDAPMNMLPVDPKAHFGNITDVRDTRKSVPMCSTPTMYPSKSDANRAWFKINDVGRDSLPGIEQTWVYLRDILKQHRFDAIFGFSQGAAMAEQISAMLERPHLFPIFCENGIAPHPTLDFIACVSGFLIRGPKLSWESDSACKTAIAAPEFGFAINTPALYVVGQTDIVVPPERSHIFVQHSKFHRVEEHHGGHFIPLKSKWPQFFISFFLNPFAEISSPTPSLSSTPSSIASTDDENFGLATPSTHASAYETGQTLPRRPDDLVHQENEFEEEQYLFSVVYDTGSDLEYLPLSALSSPPDTPFLRTPQLPVLELDEPSIVVHSDKHDFDVVADLFPSVPVPKRTASHDAESVKSKL